MLPTSVQLDVTRPDSYERPQLAIRLLLMVVLAVMGAPLGWFVGVLYLALPLVAAVGISDRGGARYLEELGPPLERGLRWLLALFAYVGLLTDRLPTANPSRQVTFVVERGGTPTVSSSLMRLLTALPTLVLLVVVGILGAVLWLLAFFFVLTTGSYPSSLFDFLRGVLRLVARLFAYQASLVEGPAPLEFTVTPGPPVALPR
ncbi:MAG: DUF4389 domain-containing protein [Myxococcota bacterium]